MLVLHANWTAGALQLWAESLDLCRVARSASAHAQTAEHNRSGDAAMSTLVAAKDHPFVSSAQDLREALIAIGIAEDLLPWTDQAVVRIRLPADAIGPLPSDRLARALGSP